MHMSSWLMVKFSLYIIGEVKLAHLPIRNGTFGVFSHNATCYTIQSVKSQFGAQFLPCFFVNLVPLLASNYNDYSASVTVFLVSFLNFAIYRVSKRVKAKMN